MSKNNKHSIVRCDILLIRLLFSNILLNLIQQRELIKDSNLSDCFKRSFAEFGMNVFRYLDKLHSVLLPFDSELGTIDTGKGSLTPICKQDVKPGESVC